MKITINNQAVQVETKITNTTPSGNVYWAIRYYIGDTTLAVAHGGPSCFPTNPLDALSIEIRETLYDFANPDAESHRAITWTGQSIEWTNSDPRSFRGTSNNRPAAWHEDVHTVREHIEYTLSQIQPD